MPDQDFDERRATTMRLRIPTLKWIKAEALDNRVSMAEIVERLVDSARAMQEREERNRLGLPT